MSADTIVEQRTRPGSSFTWTSTSRQNSVRCGVPYSRFRAAAVRCDGRWRREGGPRVPRDGQACRRDHRYVAGADYYFRVVTEGGASQPLTSAPRGPLEVSDVTRSSTTFSWLAPTSNGGAEIVAHVIEQSRAPVTDVDARRAGPTADDRRHGRQPGREDRLPLPRLRRKRRDLSDRPSADSRRRHHR